MWVYLLEERDLGWVACGASTSGVRRSEEDDFEPSPPAVALSEQNADAFPCRHTRFECAVLLLLAISETGLHPE